MQELSAVRKCQNVFNAPFSVLLAKVLSINNGELSTDAANDTNTTNSGTWNYNIWHLRTWKGPVVATSALTTPNSEEACGVTGLLEGWDYLLTGKKGKDGEITFTSCDLVMAWYDVTAEERDLLRDLREDPKKCDEKDDEKSDDDTGVKESDEKKVEGNDEKTETSDETEEKVEESDGKTVEKG
ncbi:hypothetical protein ANCCAN_27876, partial [Ancylostoma caninum]